MTTKTTKPTTTKTKSTKATSKEALTEVVTRPPAEELHYLISQRAYELYQKRGYSFGNPVEDWLLAEQQIMEAVCTPAPAPVPEPAKRATRSKTATSTAKRSATTTRTKRAPEASRS